MSARGPMRVVAPLPLWRTVLAFVVVGCCSLSCCWNIGTWNTSGSYACLGLARARVHALMSQESWHLLCHEYVLHPATPEGMPGFFERIVRT